MRSERVPSEELPDSGQPGAGGGFGSGGGPRTPSPSYTPLPVNPDLIQVERRGIQLIPGREIIRR